MIQRALAALAPGCRLVPPTIFISLALRPAVYVCFARAHRTDRDAIATDQGNPSSVMK